MSTHRKEIRARLFIVDDEAAICEVLANVLGRDGHEVLTFTDPREALGAFRENPADIIIQDLRMPKMHGLEFLREVKSIDPGVICIVFTAYDTWDSAVEAMRLGAYNYIKKPIDNDALRSMVDRAIELQRLARESGDDGVQVQQVIGNTAEMLAIESMIRRVAPTDSTVLITGEHGTGKERLARAVHQLSLRKHGPFVPLNCGGLSESLLESELFGHTRGAFTGAMMDRRGYFETASNGTLFMDEVGEMPPATQAKVLRVLEDRVVVPVGTSEGRRVNVRIIAATNRDLESEVAAGRFRADLLYRLMVIPIHLPSLRERQGDIPAIAGHFLATFGARIGKSVRSFEPAAMEFLCEQPWPGNIRELQNCIERAVALVEGEVVTLANIRGTIAGPTRGGARSLLGDIPQDGLDLESEMARVEKAYLLQALDRCDWNQKRAAELLKLTYRAMRHKMKVLEIGPKRPG